MEKIKTTIMILISLFAVSFILSIFFVELDTSDVAIIKVRGVLTVDRNPGYLTDYASSTDLVNVIKEAARNPAIKAVIFDINSPGGSPVATDEIAQAIKSMNKTSIAVIREVGASGAYWIATACDVVYANRMSITGSIGVTASYLEFSGLMERYNVSYERLVTGEFKDMGTPFRELSEKERDMFMKTLNKMNEYFIFEVSKNRNLPIEKVKELATGQIYLGVEAKELGLIDYLGNLDDAMNYLTQNYNLSNKATVFQSQRSIFSNILSGFEGKEPSLTSEIKI